MPDMAFKNAPVGYQHPRKKGKGNTAASKPSDGDSVETVAVKERESSAAMVSKPDQQEVATTLPKSVLIRLVAMPPARGQIAKYDRMIDSGMIPKDAVLGLLKNGFPQFEETILSGSYQDKAVEYDRSETAVETHRSVSLELYEAAKTRFDPFDICSKRALGLKIGTAIINGFRHVGGT